VLLLLIIYWLDVSPSNIDLSFPLWLGGKCGLVFIGIRRFTSINCMLDVGCWMLHDCILLDVDLCCPLDQLKMKSEMLVVFVYVFLTGHFSCLGFDYLLQLLSRQAPHCELYEQFQETLYPS
jgi:hypothetical protein